MKTKKKSRSIAAHLDERYGKVGTKSRIEFTEKAHNFMIAELLKDARKEANLTQKELAERLKVTRPFVSKIERAESDIRISTLHRFVESLGGKLNISIDL